MTKRDYKSICLFCVLTERQTLIQQQNAIYEYLKHRDLQIDEIVSDEGVIGGISYKKRSLINELWKCSYSVGNKPLVRSMSDLH